jgi:hypothetical protein
VPFSPAWVWKVISGTPNQIALASLGFQQAHVTEDTLENQTQRQAVLTRLLRWTARVWSIASVALVLAFMVGEGFHPFGPREWLLSLFFPIGICAGMILAWWKEGLGESYPSGASSRST